MIAVKARGLPCIYAPLKEGDRGWGGGLGLSKNLSGIELDAAYEYLNKAQLRNSWSRCLRLGGA
nr:hypothetical protein [Pleurocapsa sp. CCALA 161]